MVQGKMVELGGLQVSEKPQRTVSGACPLLGARSGWVRKGGTRQGGREGEREGPFWSTYMLSTGLCLH